MTEQGSSVPLKELIRSIAVELVDHPEEVDVTEIAPQITWGTSPEMVIAVDQRVPDPASIADGGKRRAAEAALDYMDLVPGEPIAGYLWAGQSGGRWLVAFTVGGEQCCRNRLALYVPAGGGYKRVTPPLGKTDLLGDVSCKGVDRALDAYWNG